MKIILLALGIIMFSVISITGALAIINHNTYVIGGEYIVHEGKIVQGNLYLVFAQVAMEKGSYIEGEIHSFSSAIDICGTVVGTISSFESDIKLEKSAKINAVPKDLSVMPFVILLPKAARINLSFGR